MFLNGKLTAKSCLKDTVPNRDRGPLDLLTRPIYLESCQGWEKWESNLDRKVQPICFSSFHFYPVFSLPTLPLWMQRRSPQLHKIWSYKGQASRSQNSLSGINSSTTHILQSSRQASFHCTKRQQYAVSFSCHNSSPQSSVHTAFISQEYITSLFWTPTSLYDRVQGGKTS